MKTLMGLAMLFLPMLLLSQENRSQTSKNNGIQWVDRLSWEQVKQKAKKENKYIFVDCYTTWCGPCKRMDKEVYPNDSVGAFFNDKFLPVKVQMDKTANDDDYVQSWYETARQFEREFLVQSFPTFIFLSPDGTIVHKEMGFKFPADLIVAGQKATQPGKIYDNAFIRYDRLMRDYKDGCILQFSDLPFMVLTAEKAGDTSLRQEFMKQFKSRMKSILKDQLYTKDNIEFMGSLNLSSKSEIFRVFFKNADQVNKVMQDSRYSETVVDRTILTEDISAFLNIDLSRMQISGDQVPKKPEPVWHRLSEIIKHKYGKQYAARSVIEAKIVWYKQQKDYESYARNFILKYKRLGFDSLNIESYGELNAVAWRIFCHCEDKSILQKALEWMGIISRQCVLNKDRFYPGFTSEILDTYACLLYKYGRISEAIQCEQKAVEIQGNDQATIQKYKNAIHKMKNKEPIWLEWKDYHD
jgi:thioredoxin-related protein